MATKQVALTGAVDEPQPKKTLVHFCMVWPVTVDAHVWYEDGQLRLSGLECHAGCDPQEEDVVNSEEWESIKDYLRSEYNLSDEPEIDGHE